MVSIYSLRELEVNSQKSFYLKGSLFNTSQATLSHQYLLGQTLGAALAQRE